MTSTWIFALSIIALMALGWYAVQRAGPRKDATSAGKGLNFNSSRWRLHQEMVAFAQHVRRDELVLDAGSGSAPYKRLFGRARYESADFEQLDKRYPPTTYTCDLTKIPVEDSRFDHILLNQVLEHVPEPKAVLSELHRVLKPDGRLIATMPLFYEEHQQPYDFYRYTQFGLRHLFEGAGFRIDRLDWLEGYFGTVAYQFESMARYLPWRLSTAIPKTFAGFWAFVLHRLERRVKFTARGYPKNYLVIASKH